MVVAGAREGDRSTPLGIGHAALVPAR